MEGMIEPLVDLLSDAGLSPIGVVFAIAVSVIIWRSWKREDSFAQRQAEFNRATDEELKRLREIHEKCEQDVEKLQKTNLALDRWKVICEDSCTNAEKVHKLIRYGNGRDHGY